MPGLLRDFNVGQVGSFGCGHGAGGEGCGLVVVVVFVVVVVVVVAVGGAVVAAVVAVFGFVFSCCRHHVLLSTIRLCLVFSCSACRVCGVSMRQSMAR